MLLGAVDIGSNAMRFLVASTMEYEGQWQFQRVEYLRYPVRLGEDVFTHKMISDAKIEKLHKMLSAFKQMFEVFEVVGIQACATSAMRDAQNSTQVVSYIKDSLGIDIEIVDGNREAKLIEKAIHRYLDQGKYIHIDVGGGSTEVNIIVDFEKIAAKSFNIGTVRAIHHGISTNDWDEVKTWVQTHAMEGLLGIGTGGNIKKLHELSDLRPENPLPLASLSGITDVIKSLEMEERMHKLKLNRDRADVIVPAAEIFMKILEWAGAEKIYAPNVGLVDGIAVDLWEKIVLKNKK